MNQIEEEKHRIAVMVELILYKRIKAFDESEGLDEKAKEEQKKKAIDVFVEECSKTNILTQDQIREHVEFVLNRTIENIKNLGR